MTESNNNPNQRTTSIIRPIGATLRPYTGERIHVVNTVVKRELPEWPPLQITIYPEDYSLSFNTKDQTSAHAVTHTTPESDT
jgi:hypothetical protein